MYCGTHKSSFNWENKNLFSGLYIFLIMLRASALKWVSVKTNIFSERRIDFEAPK